MSEKHPETIATKAGEYPVERKPGNWKETAGALRGARADIQSAIQLLEDEMNG